jgi:hypothetical protein
MWLAIAAVAFTSVARAETGVRSKGYAHPVFEFLVRSQTQNSGHSAPLRFAHPGARQQGNFAFRDSGSRAIIAMLPVVFIGLVSPLAHFSIACIGSLGRSPAVPLLSALFQRPPPSLA